MHGRPFQHTAGTNTVPYTPFFGQNLLHSERWSTAVEHRSLLRATAAPSEWSYIARAAGPRQSQLTPQLPAYESGSGFSPYLVCHEHGAVLDPLFVVDSRDEEPAWDEPCELITISGLSGSSSIMSTLPFGVNESRQWVGNACSICAFFAERAVRRNCHGGRTTQDILNLLGCRTVWKGQLRRPAPTIRERYNFHATSWIRLRRLAPSQAALPPNGPVRGQWP